MRPSRLLMSFSSSGWAQMEAAERFGPGGGNSGGGVEECEHSKKPNGGSSRAVCSHNMINSAPDERTQTKPVERRSHYLSVIVPLIDSGRPAPQISLNTMPPLLLLPALLRRRSSSVFIHFSFYWVHLKPSLRLTGQRRSALHALTRDRNKGRTLENVYKRILDQKHTNKMNKGHVLIIRI